MFQAIETTYYGPTNSRGSRVVAKCEAGRLSVPWDYALNVDDNHRAAAEAFAAKLGWTGPNYGPMVGGSLPGNGYAFVLLANEFRAALHTIQGAAQAFADDWAEDAPGNGPDDVARLQALRDALAVVAPYAAKRGV